MSAMNAEPSNFAIAVVCPCSKKEKKNKKIEKKCETRMKKKKEEEKKKSKVPLIAKISLTPG